MFKKFLKTTLTAVGGAVVSGAVGALATGHMDKNTIISGVLTSVLALWIKKPGTENHESPIADGK